MKLENLTERHLVEIVSLYDRHCGIGLSFGGLMYHHTPQDILDQLKKNPVREYSITSRWSMRAKLQFSTFNNEIRIGYSSNLDWEDPKLAEAEKAGEEFVEDVMQYLSQSNAKS